MLLDWVPQALQKVEDLENNSSIILIRLDEQKLYFVVDGFCQKIYPISSSRYGAGCMQDSQCTPTGLHRIDKKFGKDCLPGEIIKARIPTGVIAKPDDDGDLITSRILWLRGIESGVNAGDGVDSYGRYIYIHGTHEESLIGQPASIGCVRMKNNDVIELYDQVEVGTIVYILV